MQVLISAAFLVCAACVVVALKNSPDNSKVHISFAAMMACIGLLAIELLLLELDHMNFVVQWYWISGTATVAVPACFYLYFSASLRLESQFQKQDFLHFIPAFVYLALSIPYALLPLDQQYEVGEALRTKQPLDALYALTPIRPVRMGMVAILTAFYLPLSWHELHYEFSHKKRDVLREIQPYKWIILIFAGIFVFSFAIFTLKLPISHNWIISSVMLPIVIAFAFLYWRLPQWGHHWQQIQDTEILSEPELETNMGQVRESSEQVDHQTEQSTDQQTDKKYRSSVNVHIAESTIDKLAAAMNKGLYKDSTLTLRKLASELSISQHHLSQIINENTEGNYYDLINGYRIAEAKRLLEETDLSVIDVAYESGFNSKSTFYTEFKKQIEQTPGQFRSERKVT